MSINSTGASKRRTSDERIDEALKSGADSYLEEALSLTDSSLLIQAGVANYGVPIPGPSDILSAGDTFFGSMAFNPVTVLVDAGRINISPNISGGSKNSSYVLVTGQGSPDDIFFIDGADRNGQILIYQGTETQVQTLKHANITTIDSISGTGTVTVQTSTDHGYTTGQFVNIIGTTNFTIQNVSITVTGLDTFEYTADGDVTPESTGLVQPGNMVMPDGEDVILDASLVLNGIPVAGFIFDPTVEAFGAWRLLFTSIQTGGGGLSEPVILTINEITPETLPTTSVIDWNLNPNHITLDRDIEFSFDNLPVSGSYEGVLVIIDVDGTGGFAAPIWPASLLNAPTVDTTANTRTSVMLYTIDGGTLVTHAKSTGSANTSVTNQIAQGDSSVTVTDTGSNGNVITLIDGTQRFSIQDDRIDFAVDDVFGLKTLNFDNTLGASTITPSTSGVVWNFPDDTNKLSVDFDGNDGIAISKDNTIFFSGTPGSVSAAIRLFRNETVGVPAIGDAVGTVHFDGTDTVDTLQEYALINGGIRDVTLGSEEGSLVLQVATAGTLADIVDIDSAEVIIKTLLNMDTHTISNVVDPTSDQEAATKKYVDDTTGVQSSIVDGNTTATVLDSAPSFVVVLDGIQKYSISNTRVDYADLDLFGINQINMTDSSSNDISTLTASATGLLLNMINTSDVYDIKFNSVDAFHVDELKTLITSTTPNTSSASLFLFRDDASPTLDDVVGDIEFRGRDTDTTNIVYGKIGVEIENAAAAVSSGSFQWTVRNLGLDQDMMSLKDGVLGVSRDSVTLTAAQGAAMVLVRNDTGLTIGDEAGELDFNINDGTERVFGNISVTFDDSSGGDDSSRMDFKLLTDDALQTILTIRGSPITDNKISMEFGEDSFIKASAGVMGYFVTNDPAITSSIGNSGSLQFPQINDGSPTLSQLNAAGGAFDGMVVHDINDGRLYVRNSSTQWDFYSRSGTVV